MNCIPYISSLSYLSNTLLLRKPDDAEVHFVEKAKSTVRNPNPERRNLIKQLPLLNTYCYKYTSNPQRYWKKTESSQVHQGPASTHRLNFGWIMASLKCKSNLLTYERIYSKVIVMRMLTLVGSGNRKMKTNLKRQYLFTCVVILCKNNTSQQNNLTLLLR